MRMPDANHVGVHILQAAGPELDVRIGIFIEWIARRSVHKEKARIVDCHELGHGKVAEEAQVVRPEPLLGDDTRDAAQVLETGAS